MAKKLLYTRGDNQSVFELIGPRGRVQKRLVIPKSGLTKSHTLDLGDDGVFVNKNAAQIQIESFRDFEAGAGVNDYEENAKMNYVVVDPEYGGNFRFFSSIPQSFDTRSLYPNDEVALRGVLTLLAVKAASA
jgi:hypothetical protein